MATSSRRRPSAQPAANPATPADDLSTTPASDQPAAKASPARKPAKATPAAPAAKATKATKTAKTGDTTKAVKPAKAAAATPEVTKPARPARKKPVAKVAPAKAIEAEVAAAVVDVAVEPMAEPAAEPARAVAAAPKPAARPRQRGRKAATAEQTTETAAERPVATVTAAADTDNGALDAVVVAAETAAHQGAGEVAPTAPEAEADVAPAAPPAPPAPAHSSITLVDGIRRRLAWQAGSHCPDTLLQAVSRWQDERGQLRLNDADGLSELLALAARLGHPLEVSDAVWAHVAAHSDLRQRIDHLEAQYPHGLDAIAHASAEAHHPLRPCQLEAAFFAACVGACVLADEPALQIEAPLALAWTLVQRHFGAAGLTVLAPASAWPQWQAALSAAQAVHVDNADLNADLNADITTAPAPITWLDADDAQAVASATATDVLLADVRGSTRSVPEHLATATWLWAVADAHLLGPQPGQRAQAEALLHAVDRLRQGALADWLEHGDIDALAPLLLQRRFADVAEQWPAWTSATADCTLSAEQAETHQTGLTQIAAQLARWQRSGFLSDTEQLALQRQVLGLLHLSEAASTAALPGLLRTALDAGTTRVIVFNGAGHSLAALAEALQAQGLPVQALPSASSPRQADAAARAFRDAPDAQVLLVADGVPGAEPRIGLNNVRPLVLHLDRPWSSAVLLRRLRRVRAGRAQREVPVLQCLATGSLAAMRAALDPLDLSALELAESADRTAAPAEVLGSVPRLLRGETLRGWLTDLLACLGDAPAAEAPETATASTPATAPASISVTASEQG